MLLATSDDVVSALGGRALTPSESDSVANLLAQASDLVAGYLGRFPDPVPGAVARVTATMVAAVFEKPSITNADYDVTGYSTAREYAQVSVGNESATSSGPWLTRALKIRLRPYRRGMFTIHTVDVDVEAGS